MVRLGAVGGRWGVMGGAVVVVALHNRPHRLQSGLLPLISSNHSVVAVVVVVVVVVVRGGGGGGGGVVMKRVALSVACCP